MIAIETRLRELVDIAASKGYTISMIRVTWTAKLKRASVRIKVTPYPGHDSRRGEWRNAVSGSLQTIEEFILGLERL